jgi:hypothetical protein
VSLPGVAELLRPVGPGPASDPGRQASGREAHPQKITVYLSADEFFDLERARLTLRMHGIGVDRGRLVREAIAVLIADLEAGIDVSVIARRLRAVGQPGPADGTSGGIALASSSLADGGTVIGGRVGSGPLGGDLIGGGLVGGDRISGDQVSGGSFGGALANGGQVGAAQVSAAIAGGGPAGGLARGAAGGAVAGGAVAAGGPIGGPPGAQ